MRVLFALLLATVANAAPVLKEKSLYIATDVGTVLEYEHKNGDLITSRTATITAVESKDGQTFVTRKFRYNDRETTHKYQVSEVGLFVVARDGRELATPEQILKLPVKADEKWLIKNEQRTKDNILIDTSRHFRTIGEEEVELPVGKFKAIRVENYWMAPSASGKESRITGTSWYVRGIGLVKHRYEFATDAPKQEEVLKSIKTSKK